LVTISGPAIDAHQLKQVVVGIQQYIVQLRDFLLNGSESGLYRLAALGRELGYRGTSIEELQKIHRMESENLLAGGHHGEAADILARALSLSEALNSIRHRDQLKQNSGLVERIEVLDRSEENLQRALRLAGAAYWDWDLQSGYWDGSTLLKEKLGLDSGALQTYEGYLSHVHPDDRVLLEEAVNGAVDARTEYRVSYRVVLPDGSIRHLQEQGRLVSKGGAESDHVSAVVYDDSERQNALREVVDLAYNEAVTGLPNRKFLLGDLQQQMIQAEQENHMAALMVIDLDNFRSVNDSRGQEFGDSLLKEVGSRLKDSCGEVGTVGCLGGDEFVVVTGEAVHVDDLSVLAADTLKELAAPFCIDGRDVHLTASIGIAMFPSDASTPINLCQTAQMAVTRAKGEGGNAYAFFDELMAAAVLEGARIRSALVPALQNSEFSMHYQPKVSIGTGQIMGLEALIRWTSPKLGAVSPAAFIPVAEEMPLIQKLGEWIIDAACRHHRQWSDAGCPVPPIAVNVAGPQLRTGFVEMVERTLAEHGLASRHLHMELTETSLIQNLNSTVPITHDLRNLGIDLSIDDFGTGYSSLSYLQSFPVNELKIDRSFVDGLGDNEGSKAIVTATIALAHSLGLSVIAEGVETREQLAVLRDLECDAIQGYLVSRPVPAEEVPALLDSHKGL